MLQSFIKSLVSHLAVVTLPSDTPGKVHLMRGGAKNKRLSYNNKNMFFIKHKTELEKTVKRQVYQSRNSLEVFNFHIKLH